MKNGIRVQERVRLDLEGFRIQELGNLECRRGLIEGLRVEDINRIGLGSSSIGWVGIGRISN